MNQNGIPTKTAATDLLRVSGLSVSYGTVRALENVSFVILTGQIVGLIGPNGAGKSTALKAISGLISMVEGRIDSGKIIFGGENIKGLRPDQLVKKGISLVPEGRRVFSTMTVWENLEMGAYSVSGSWADGESKRRLVRERAEKVFDLFPVLKGKMKRASNTLSSGEQQMLALGRALMLKPKLLLADEPSLGLSHNFVELVFGKLADIRREGTTILLVEQNVNMALEVCDRAYMFERGSIAAGGGDPPTINIGGP